MAREGQVTTWHEGLNRAHTKEKPVTSGCLAKVTAYRTAALHLRALRRRRLKVGIDKDGTLLPGAYGWLRDEAKAQRLDVAVRSRAPPRSSTGCAHCYQYYKVLYPKLGFDTGLKIWHVTEYLAQLLAKGTLKPCKEVDLTVTYHDPCHLGRLSEPWIPWEGKQRERHMRVYEPPRTFRGGAGGVYEPRREVLRSIPGLKLVEMDRIKEYSWCCGAGGGVRESNPEFARWTAVERLNEAESTGADALVTACPHCSQNLQGAGGDGGSIGVCDIVELLDRAI